MFLVRGEEQLIRRRRVEWAFDWGAIHRINQMLIKE
jgi:hypothetical protein